MHSRMAATFCLFTLALCQDFGGHVPIGQPLSAAQFVTIPKVLVSQCPNIFRYAFDGKDWIGLIKVPRPAPKGVPSKLKVLLSIGFHLSSSYVGQIELEKDKKSAVADIQQGLPLLYRIKFPVQNPVPKLTAIYYNDHLICAGPRDLGQFVTTITLEHKLTTGLQELGRASTAHWTPTEVTFAPRPTPPRFTVIEDCGLVDNKLPLTTGLIVRGKDVRRGQFPWLAAYYHSSPGESGFICSGSLISQRLIVTAAHCIQGKFEFTRRRAEEAQFFLGKNNLNTLSGEPGSIVSGVSEFIIHPDWNHTADSYDADIALAVLSRTIVFNKFVKPICLWTNTIGYEDLIGKQGLIAGWGKTERDAVSTSRPKWSRIPVVSETACIRSDKSFGALTSERTFCAGDPEGKTGPCNGDSGGGFIVDSGNRWYLRGIISASLLDEMENTCDTKKFAVFTDLTSFGGWLQTAMQKHG